MMADYHIAKWAAFLLAIAIIAIYRRNILLAFCGFVATLGTVCSLNADQRIPSFVRRAAPFCAFSFGLLTFVLWLRLMISQQRSKAQ